MSVRWDEAVLFPVGGQRSPSEGGISAGTWRERGNKPDL